MMKRSGVKRELLICLAGFFLSPVFPAFYFSATNDMVTGDLATLYGQGVFLGITLVFLPGLGLFFLVQDLPPWVRYVVWGLLWLGNIQLMIHAILNFSCWSLFCPLAGIVTATVITGVCHHRIRPEDRIPAWKIVSAVLAEIFVVIAGSVIFAGLSFR